MTVIPSAVREVARGGAWSFAGAAFSALAGFLFVMVLGRVLGAEGAGVVLQVVAAFSIALSVARAGLDTAAVWLLPRLADERGDEMRPAVVALLWPSFFLGLAVAGLLVLLAPVLDPSDSGLGEALRYTAWFMPVAAVATIALAVSRGLGGIRIYVAVGNIAVPALRPLLVVLAAWAGAGATLAAVAWVMPFPVAALVLAALVARAVRRGERRTGARGRLLADRALTLRIWSFALPRSVATILEQVMLWLDVVVVGVLAGPEAAGLYGAATRVVGAGLILSTSLRIVVAPLYSRMLGQGDLSQVQRIYTMATQWVMLVSVPIYVMLACFGEAVLSLMGEEFTQGAAALVILSAGMVLILVAGNVQAVLLMSGHSGRAAVNKAIAVGINVVGLLVLVPRWGIEGAAFAWCLAMLVDTGLAAYQVRRRVGVRIGGSGIFLAAAVSLGSFVGPGLIASAWIGQSWLSLLFAGALGAGLWLVAVGTLRDRFHLTDVVQLMKSRSQSIP
ncbi:flippase [Ornithinimicrobium cavernae]|uniref:flippase n=1 Tax=Ornithinimicrobium cavernae TaxID=2666047 RepID=UPI000D68B6CF|nr:flippase [Ornithinimicrobium cavernae]